MRNDAWGPGPWDDEPDRKEWSDAATGLPCLAVRNDGLGFWCGYVAVPPAHPAHGKEYDDVDAHAHGGLTYSAACDGHICHVPKPGEPDNVWWLGFDCGHFGDMIPFAGALPTHLRSRGEYRSLGYVEAECAALAQQLMEMAKQ